MKRQHATSPPPPPAKRNLSSLTSTRAVNLRDWAHANCLTDTPSNPNGRHSERPQRALVATTCHFSGRHQTRERYAHDAMAGAATRAAQIEAFNLGLRAGPAQQELIRCGRNPVGRSARRAGVPGLGKRSRNLLKFNLM